MPLLRPLGLRVRTLEVEREVLALLSIGRSDLGISAMIFVTRKTVEFHTRNSFRKLRLPVSDRDNRRVHAVLDVPRGRVTDTCPLRPPT